MNSKQQEWEDKLPMTQGFKDVTWEEDHLLGASRSGIDHEEIGGLMLSRYVNQTIIINNNIRITVASIDKGQVRLAIRAPEHIPIHRKEVQDKINKEINRKINEQKEQLNGKK